jgi:hypothetical protein
MKYYIGRGREEYPKTLQRRKTNWIGHILHRNCLLKHIEGRIEAKGRRGIRLKKLLDDLKKEIIKEIDHSLWIIRCGRGYRPVVIQTTE